MILNKKFIFDDRTKGVYLEHLAQHGLPATAAKLIGTSTRRVKAERETDREFDEACDEAELLFQEVIETEIRRRAIDGVEEELSYQGRTTGDTVTKYSDSLLQFMGKAKLPQYGDKLKVEQHVTGGVFLTAAPATSTQAWLESTKPQQLPAPTEEDNVLDVEGSEVKDVVPV